MSTTEMTTAAAPAVLSSGDESAKQVWRSYLEKARIALAKGIRITADPKDFYPLAGQPRTYFGPESMARMALSLSSIGQIFDAIVRKAPPGSTVPYQILDGERRWRGATQAKLPFRGLQIDVEDDVIPYILAAVANFNRESHVPTEVANTIQTLLGLGIPMDEISKMIGMSIAWAEKLYSLKKLEPRVWDMLDPAQKKDQILPVTVAIEIAKADPSIQFQIAQRFKDKVLTAKSVRGEAVRLSALVGEPIRTRKRAVRKTWRSLVNMSAALDRTSSDIDEIMRDSDAATILSSRDSVQVQALIDSLEATRLRLVRCDSIIKRLRRQ